MGLEFSGSTQEVMFPAPTLFNWHDKRTNKMQEEIWKDVVGYEGFYRVSNMGRIKSIDRIVEWNGTERMFKGVMLKPCACKKGYLRVNLHRDGILSSTSVHRAVAIAFIGNPCHKKEVNHINGIKDCNNIENLEWTTASENQKHAYSIGLKTNAYIGIFGKRHHNSKCVVQLSIDNVFIKEYESMNLASIDTMVYQGGISNCCNGKQKSTGGYQWMYAADYYKQNPK